MKIAIYARVSTEDQARHGLSIDTQLDNLRTWARQNGHSIVKEYVDAGVSGKKPVSKRPALSQFMTEIENPLHQDLSVADNNGHAAAAPVKVFLFLAIHTVLLFTAG